jgi:hypothetical protein
MHESRIVSAYHNYMLTGRLQSEFVLSCRDQGDGFLLRGHRVEPGDTVPLLSGNIYNAEGRLLAVIGRNVLLRGRSGLSLLCGPRGLALKEADGTTLLCAETVSFANGFITRIRGLFYGADGQAAAWGDDLGLHIAEQQAPMAAVNQSG